MHGITLTKAPADWEILQQENGKASVALKGNFQVHPAAIEVGVERVIAFLSYLPPEPGAEEIII